MTNYTILVTMCTLLPLLIQAQVSFGIKAGSTAHLSNQPAFGNGSHNISDIRSNIDAKIKYLRAISPPDRELYTNDPVLLDSLSQLPPGQRMPINFELGIYMSFSASLKSRMRIEIAYHDFNLQYGLNDWPNKRAGHLIPVANNSGPFLSSFYVPINNLKVQFIRPSLHYQYYFTSKSALSLGVSYSIAMNEARTRGFIYGSFETLAPPGESEGIFYEFIHSLDELALAKNEGIFGLNLGYLTKVWNLPKIEIRGAYYFSSSARKINVAKEATFPELSQPIRYGFELDTPDHYTVSLFIEI